MSYKNKDWPIEKRVEDLLSQMTLDEKLQQMHCFGCVYSAEEVISMFKDGKNGVDAEFYTFKYSTPAILNEIQRGCIETTRLGIPAFISTECVHGAPVPQATIFPTNGCLAATFDLDLARRTALVEGKELKLLGFNRVYSPNVDLLRDGRWGRCGEDYGEDPLLCGLFGAEKVKALQEQGIEATIKHYVGYSMPEGGLNLGSGHIGEREMREYFLPSFAKCIEAGAMGVMNSYNEVDGIPSGVDPLWMTKVLREELGFEGDVITDYGVAGIYYDHHNMVSKNLYNVGKAFLNANIDIEACGFYAYGPEMKEMVEKGEVDISLIDRSVRRILTNKFKLGLFDNPYVDEYRYEQEVLTKESRELTYEIAAKGAVLLKNNGILPLKNKQKILLVGPNSMIAQLGGIVYYPFSQDGKFKDICSASKAIKTHEAFIDKFGKDNVKVIPCCNFLNVDNKQIREAVKQAKEWADVIIFAGGNNAMGYSGGQNGGMDNPIDLPDACTSNEGYDTDDICLCESQKTVFNVLKKCNKPIVFLIYEGKPCAVTEELDDISALMYCFGVGMDGNRAIADIIAGDVVPSGKMTFTIPRSVGQIPIFYNRKPLRGIYDRPGNKNKPGQDYVFSSKDPLFEFGDGLSYTTFKYENLIVKKEDDGFDVSIDVKNTGKYSADESVLVYAHSDSNWMVAPNLKNLRAFKRIHLNIGEKKTVHFKLTKDDFSYIGIDMKKTLPGGMVKVIVKDLEQSFDLHK